MSETRRQIRLRKEYLYRKSLEGKEKEDYERKDKIRKALAAGKPVPTELREFASTVRSEMEAEDAATRKAKLAVDDEYATAGIKDPRVCVTTSRSPSSRLKQFAKELRVVLPNAQSMNRGMAKVDEIVSACRRADFTDLVVVNETRGEPDALIISHLPHGPTIWFTLSGTVMRHDIEGRGTISEAYPHLLFDRFATPVGTRVQTILTHLFPVPKHDSQRVITFANRSDTISFRHHTFKKVPRRAKAGETSKAERDPAVDTDRDPDTTSSSAAAGGGRMDVDLVEVGPRFEMTPFQIKLGTLDQPESETEWVLRPYMRTASKRSAL